MGRRRRRAAERGDPKKILSPGLDRSNKHYSGRINDIDHLTGHAFDKRDIFVTEDGGIRCAARKSRRIVIWRNVNGLYAATQIVAVTDDTRGQETNECTMVYAILACGGRDFSAS